MLTSARPSSLLQSHWVLRVAILLSWFAFLVSFHLPAFSALEIAGTTPGTPVNGWQAIPAMLYGFHPAIWLTAPGTVILVSAIFISNVTGLAVPLIVFLCRDECWVASLILVVGAMCAWLLPASLLGERLNRLQSVDWIVIEHECSCRGNCLGRDASVF